MIRSVALRRTSWLPRGNKPLRSRIWLRKTKPIRRYVGLQSKSAPKPARPSTVPNEVRVALRNRSGRLCEIRRVGCQQWAMHIHHRITTKAGGRHGEAKVEHDRLSDLLDVCGACHDWVTHNPVLSQMRGWSLLERQNPAEEWVMYRGEVRYLDDDGGVHDAEQVCA